MLALPLTFTANTLNRVCIAFPVVWTDECHAIYYLLDSISSAELALGLRSPAARLPPTPAPADPLQLRLSAPKNTRDDTAHGNQVNKRVVVEPNGVHVPAAAAVATEATATLRRVIGSVRCALAEIALGWGWAMCDAGSTMAHGARRVATWRASEIVLQGASMRGHFRELHWRSRGCQAVVPGLYSDTHFAVAVVGSHSTDR